MEAILRVSRSRQHALTTALRVDMAYLCVGVRTVFSLLLAPLFSVIFQRLWLVIAVLTTTVVAYGISYVIASRIFASREW